MACSFETIILGSNREKFGKMNQIEKTSNHHENKCSKDTAPVQVPPVKYQEVTMDNFKNVFFFFLKRGYSSSE